MLVSQIEIEFCSRCGYTLQFEELKKYINEHFPDLIVIGKEGMPGSFEVKINGKLIFSKFMTGGFPNHEDIINEIETLISGGNPKLINNTAAKVSICSLS
ncbi:unnamed protein product [Gordionus sp. m RMFG-2023]